MKNRICGGRLCFLALLLTSTIAVLFLPKPLTEMYVAEYSPAKETIEEKQELALPQELLDIAFCESSDRQFNADGTVLRGRENPKDVGRFQLNEFYWLAKSKQLGFDIYTLEGNTEMALWIYNKHGVTPWSWSAKCHNHY